MNIFCMSCSGAAWSLLSASVYREVKCGKGKAAEAEEM